jgi:hypothetical protein
MIETISPQNFSQSRLQEKHNYNISIDADDQFEQDWQTAISGDELVKRVHHHIDQLYAAKRNKS